MRGGGLYACGFALTFAWLEIGSFFDDIAGIGMVFDGQIVDFILSFIIDSFKNTIAAFMWPLDILALAQPWGAVALGLAFWLFPIYVKPHIEKWMFSDQVGSGDSTETD